MSLPPSDTQCVPLAQFEPRQGPSSGPALLHGGDQLATLPIHTSLPYTSLPLQQQQLPLPIVSTSLEADFVAADATTSTVHLSSASTSSQLSGVPAPLPTTPYLTQPNPQATVKMSHSPSSAVSGSDEGSQHSTGGSTSSNTTYNSSARATIPRSPAEWEAVKSIIEDLYFVQNIRVQDVAEIMMRVHRFKATPRMYKQRFLKWKWQKYNNPQVGMRKGAKSGSTANAGRRNLPQSQHVANLMESRQQRRQSQKATSKLSTSPTTTSPTIDEDDSLPSSSPTYSTHVTPYQARRQSQVQLTLAPHDIPETYHLNSVLHGWTTYLHHWSVADPRFRTPTKFHVLTGAGAALSYISKDFQSALQHLQRGENRIGGRLLRYGFLRLEEALLDDHVEAVWVLCIQIPLMLLEAGYGGLLDVYLRHVGGILKARMGAAHPLNRIVRDIRALTRHSSVTPPSPTSPTSPTSTSSTSSTSSSSTTSPTALTRYAVAAGTLWVDTFTTLRGGADAVSLMLRNAFLFTLGAAHASPAFIASYLHDMDALAADARTTFGASSVEALGREADALDKRWKHRSVVRIGLGEVLSRTETLLRRVEWLLMAVASPDAIETLESPTQANPRRKLGEAYLRGFFLQTVVGDHMGDLALSTLALRRFLANRKEHDVYFKCACMDLEPYLRGKGRAVEAEVVQAFRLGEQVPEGVMRELDEAEGEGLGLGGDGGMEEGEDDDM